MCVLILPLMVIQNKVFLGFFFLCSYVTTIDCLLACFYEVRNYTKAVGFHSKRIYGIIIETLYLLISTLEHNLRRESPSSCRNTEVMVLDFCPSILSLFWIQYYFSPSSVLYSLVFSLVILHLWVYLYFWFMFSCLCLFPVMSSACVSPVMFLFIPSMSHVCFPFTVTLCVPSYPSFSRLPCLSCVSVFFSPYLFLRSLLVFLPFSSSVHLFSMSVSSSRPLCQAHVS